MITSKFIKYLKTNKLLKYVYRKMIKMKFKLQSFMLIIPATFRWFGWKDPKFVELKDWKNKFAGKRCFIIATGPSLLVEDLEKLKNEYTFGMNSVCLLGNRTDWRPTLFGIQDEYVYEKVKDSLLSEHVGQVFVPYNFKKKFDIPEEWIAFPINGKYNAFESQIEHKFFARFSSNAYSLIWGGYTITYSIIQLAVYMGFKEIYLLGCDCNYQKGKTKNFIEHGNIDPSAEEFGYLRMTAAYEVAKKWCDSHDVKIYNATRGGMLEVFPRVCLEDVLDEQNKNNC